MSLFLSLFLSLPGLAQSLGFSTGNELSVRQISGLVTVTCPAEDEGLKTAQFLCRGIDVSPDAFAYFLGPRGVFADQVQLTIIWADGSRRALRPLDYDSSRGQTKEQIELWPRAGLVRASLSQGLNRVQYRLLSRGQVVSEGEFSVNVERLESKRCEGKNYVAVFPSDCDNQFTICERFFTDLNNCR
jgi:hypothetical protein